MKTTIRLLLAMAITFSFASCRKEIPTKMTGYFYTTDIQIDEAQYRLWIDGVDKGSLPYIEVEKLTSIDSSMKMNALRVEFMSGRHVVQSKNSAGEIVSSSEINFEFYKNRTVSGVSSGIGGSGHARFDKNNEVVIWLSK